MKLIADSKYLIHDFIQTGITPIHEFDIPLGALYDVSMEIVNTESQIGEFEQLSYMLVHKGQFIIDKKKPYPDKFYILKTKDSDYKFQFFVQGEEL